MTIALNENETGEDFDPSKDPLDTEFLYPNAARLLDFVHSMNQYGLIHEIQADTAIGLDIEEAPTEEKVAFANELCNQFAGLEKVTNGDVGTIMMVYEGIIFKVMWDLKRLEEQQKPKSVTEKLGDFFKKKIWG